jgi:glycosyltransferase involved in cell wall biosynthesis
MSATVAEADGRGAADAPIVSVLMPVYDAECYLDAAIESILGQTFRDFEFLIYDDGSTDRSAAMLERWQERDPRIRLFRESHAGLTTWLQAGLAEARGRYLARMDADDVARLDRLERQVDYLGRHPECDALGAQALLIDPDGRPIRLCTMQVDHARIDAELLQGRGEALLHPVVMFRREALIAAGGYRCEYETAEDLDLYLRLAERGRLANLAQVLLEYRQHPAKVSARRAGEQIRTANAVIRAARRRRGIEEGAELPMRSGPDELPAIEYSRRWAREAIEGGFLPTARRHAWAVFRQQPLSWRSWQLLLRAWLGIRIEPWREKLAGRHA